MRWSQASGAIAGAVLCTLALTSCGSKWLQIEGVTAGSREATTIRVDYGPFCWSADSPMPSATVIESDTEVRITPNVPAPKGDQKKCLTDGEQITLDKPIGDRKVVDTRTGARFTVTFGSG